MGFLRHVVGIFKAPVGRQSIRVSEEAEPKMADDKVKRVVATEYVAIKLSGRLEV